MAKSYMITQGEHCAIAERDATISTLLGSCVACCLWDPVAGVGGMNHMLLALRSHKNTFCDMAGVNAMELLINDMQKLGAERSRIQAKAFGGAQMVSGLSDIGPANANFVLDFLEREGIVCTSRSLGGTNARQVVFTPSTGAARVRVHSNVEPEPVVRIPEPRGNGIELF